MCPKCGRVWGPHVDGCESCNLYPKTGGTEWTTCDTTGTVTRDKCPVCGIPRNAPAGSIGCIGYHYTISYDYNPAGIR